LGIGEMLDRAVSISVRFITLFAAIYVVFAIPLAVFQYFGTADLAKIFGTIVDNLQKAGQTPDQAAIMKALAIPPVFNVFTVLYFTMVLLVAPLPRAALMWAAAEIYVRGRAPSIRDAYSQALRCWLPIIGVNLLWVALALVVYVALALVVVFAALGAVLLNAVLKGVGLALVLAASLVLLIALLVAAFVALVALYVSYLSVVVESAGFITAFASGLARVFARSLRRSILVALTLGAVLFGVAAMGGTGQVLLYGVLRNNALGTAFSSLLSLVAVIFTSVFIAIYYYDVRVRTEGLDLELAAVSSAPALDVAAR
jgi:hypothetical protein